MEIRFTKMHGAGNDFVIIDDMEGRCRLSGAAIARLCSRHRGIGGDGLIIIRRSARGRFAMLYFNSDGGEADMCGNGARCAAAFAFASGITGPSMTFETGAGIVQAEILGDGVRIGIGDVRALSLGMRIAAADLPVHYGVCGVPHAVIIERELLRRSHGEFVRFAAGVRSDPSFGAAGANVNVVGVTDRHRCAYRTYERGVEDETFACGTGAVVITVVLAHLGLADFPLVCQTYGNDILEVTGTLTPDGATGCYLKGPVATSFSGTLRTEDYEHP